MYRVEQQERKGCSAERVHEYCADRTFVVTYIRNESDEQCSQTCDSLCRSTPSPPFDFEMFSPFPPWCTGAPQEEYTNMQNEVQTDALA
jgi:hypothetical protein